MGKLGKKVIRLVESHPEGIPLSQLAVFYNQTYHHNLVVANAGFSSVADFICSLAEHLVVKNDTVFHKEHLPQTQDTTEQVQVPQSNLKGIFFFLHTGKNIQPGSINAITHSRARYSLIVAWSLYTMLHSCRSHIVIIVDMNVMAISHNIHVQ